MPRFHNTQKKLPSLKNIKAFEKELDLKLPEAYKQQLLKYNGGMTSAICYFELEDGEQIDFQRFIAFKEGKKRPLRESHLEFDRDLLPPKYLTIGHISGGYIAIRLDSKNYGKIYSFFSEVELEKIANSFTDLMNSLRNEIIFGRQPHGMTYKKYKKLLKTDKLKLPIAYRDFICGTNGGVPTPNSFTSETGKTYKIKCFFSLEKEAHYYEIEGVKLYSSKLIMKYYRDEKGVLSKNFYPFANGEDEWVYCIQMKKKGFGSVHLLNLDEKEPKPEFICDSFDYFLKNIEEPYSE